MRYEEHASPVSWVEDGPTVENGGLARDEERTWVSDDGLTTAADKARTKGSAYEALMAYTGMYADELGSESFVDLIASVLIVYAEDGVADPDRPDVATVIEDALMHFRAEVALDT